MFSKSKRFPEVGKDYIPGPGEYDVSSDDTGRHKRYGFLTQTNRFPEGTDPSESSEPYISTNHEGTTVGLTTTSLSSDTRVSSTSSNRTTEDTSTSPTANKSAVKKLPSSPTTENSNSQFEKYRYTMQREIEALQIKSRKMETTIQSLETEKNDTKAILLSKDLELADLRSKNATLQKTITRQEKSTKAAQLQKKVEQLEEHINTLQLQHEKELKDKNQIIEQLEVESNRRVSIIANLEQVQQEQKEKHEALEAQVASLSAQLSEYKNSATQREIQISQLQQELERMENTNTTLMQDLETQKNEITSLKTLNNELMTQLHTRQETISQLESRVVLKDEEIDALLNTIDERDRTVQDKSTIIEKLQNQFKTYRHWMEHTVVPHLRSQRKAAQEHPYTELNQLLTELHEAKKFMNRQAQYLDGLKSDVHWLTVQNQQLGEILSGMGKERTEQYNLNKKKLFSGMLGSKQQHHHQQQKHKSTKQRVIDDDVSDTVSYSSRSTISYRDDEHNSNSRVATPLDSNVIVLNDSGFGILIDEAK